MVRLAVLRHVSFRRFFVGQAVWPIRAPAALIHSALRSPKLAPMSPPKTAPAARTP
jgi:hypothetical protein